MFILSRFFWLNFILFFGLIFFGAGHLGFVLFANSSEYVNSGVELVGKEDFLNRLGGCDSGFSVVLFYSENCPESSKYFAFISEVLEDSGGSRFFKIDIANIGNRELIKAFDVVQVPAVLAIKNGKLLGKTTEDFSKEKFEKFFKNF